MEEHHPPAYKKEAFHCPHCHTYAHHTWDTMRRGTANRWFPNWRASICTRCNNHTIWTEDEEMVYPRTTIAPEPSEDMPEDVMVDYQEAQHVVEDSPRAAAALLRLAMEKLARELTEDEDKKLYQMIGDLKEEGRIDDRIQQALDSVRVTGNNWVHPGELNVTDDYETAYRLFELVNAVVKLTIARDNLIEEQYAKVPENKKKGIEQRDDS